MDNQVSIDINFRKIYQVFILILILISTHSESESEPERYLFDPYKKCIQSNNETILDQGTPIKTSLVANIRAAYDIINTFLSISQAKNT